MNPELSSMIQEPIDDARNDVGKTPLNPEEFKGSSAVRNEASDAGKLAQLGSETATEIQRVFEQRGVAEATRSAELQEIKETFLKQIETVVPGTPPQTALKMLAEQLKVVHDTYYEGAKSGLNDEAMARSWEVRAAEIDAFLRSLTKKEEIISGTESAVKSEAGQAFLARLKSGEFPPGAGMVAQAALAEELSEKVGKEISEDEFKTLYKLADELLG